MWTIVIACLAGCGAGEFQTYHGSYETQEICEAALPHVARHWEPWLVAVVTFNCRPEFDPP